MDYGIEMHQLVKKTFPIGMQKMVNGILFTRVSLAEIQAADESSLKQSKLDALVSGANTQRGTVDFFEVINNPDWEGNRVDREPIKLLPLPPNDSGMRYEIINGRHRIFLAKHFQYEAVWAWI